METTRETQDSRMKVGIWLQQQGGVNHSFLRQAMLVFILKSRALFGIHHVDPSLRGDIEAKLLALIALLKLWHIR